MNVKQHIRMTASEIAMGRYMRAPDHPAADEFSAAFEQAALEPGGVATTGGGAGDAGGSGDNAGAGAAAPGADGSGEAAGAAGTGAAGDAAPAAGEGEGAQTPAAGSEGAEDGAGGDAGGAAGGDAGAAAAAGDGGAAGKAGAKTPPVPADTAGADDILNRLADAVASKTPPAPAAAEPPAGAEEAPKPIFSETEQATLAKFKEDWPQEAQAVELMQRELGTGIIDYVFQQIAPAVKEIRDTVATLALRQHVGDLNEAIGDYSDDEVDQVKAWVGTQPAYLQAGMNGVINGGTAEEVADLVGRYRDATGTQPAPKPAVAQGASGGETELSGAAKQAAAALAPVDSKRSVVQNPEDKSDFDAGWAQFADIQV